MGRAGCHWCCGESISIGALAVRLRYKATHAEDLWGCLECREVGLQMQL